LCYRIKFCKKNKVVYSSKHFIKPPTGERFLISHTLTIETKGFVVTGNFDLEREVIKDFLLQQGGKVKARITSNVDYVIAGKDCGWAKIQKVNEFNNTKKGNIKILSEIDLEFLMNKYFSE